MMPVCRQIGLAATCVAFVALSFDPANAFRPFDGTDAGASQYSSPLPVVTSMVRFCTATCASNGGHQHEWMNRSFFRGHA
jgi:hypothetical protein